MAAPLSLLRLLTPGLALLLAACSTSCSQQPSPADPAAGAGPVAEAAPEAPPPPEASPEGGEGGEGPEIESQDGMLPAEIATVGWDGLTNSPIVLVREIQSGRVVPIWVGVAEARAIAAALHGIEFPRPMTHDLMRNLVAELGATLEEVQISDLREGTYYGLLKLRVEGRSEPLMVDTRPSDGMALALRTGAELRLSQRILDQTPDYDFLAPDAGDQVVQTLGLTVVAASDEWREELDLPDRPGVVVTTAVGEAARRGLRRGDLIVEINGAVPDTPMAFLDAVRAAPPAAPVAITYWRAGEEHQVELLPPLRPRPPDEGKQIA